MPLLKHSRVRGRRYRAMCLAAVAGIVSAALVGIALAKTITLAVATGAKVTSATGMTKAESIVVNSQGFAVYDLTGDSKRHPECTKAKGCFKFWPPVIVPSASKLSDAPGISGKLGVWHHDGFLQVTLGGHPLYRFAPDTHARVATGEGVHGFGGTWHVITASSPGNATGTTTGTTTTSTTPTTPTTPTCAYPPCY